MPLKGIKVIELAGLAPGPFCGMVLADFGASVVRIDRATRSSGALDCLVNGKRSVGLDIKSPEGAKILKQMSDQSDVLIDPYRAGIMEKLKLGPRDLCASNDRLVYARLTGFGQEGPFAKMAGHDVNYVALSGILSLLGRRSDKPLPPINLAADFGGGGLMCALGIVLALYDRTRTNLGQIVDASMVDGTAYLGSWLYRARDVPGLWGQPRGENILDGGAHFYDTYETKDGNYVAVGAIESQFYTILLEKLNLREEELLHFGDFEEGRNRLGEIFKSKTQEEWCDIFDGTDACVTPVLSLEAAPVHPHNVARRAFEKSADGTVVPRPAPRLSRTPGFTRGLDESRLPYGRDSTEVLLDYGFEMEDIRKHIAAGTVHQAAKSSKL